MKKIVYSIFSVAAVIVLTAGARKSSGPPGCHAGELPHLQTCVSCHDDRALNSGTADIFFDLGGAESGYALGQTYTITIAIKKAGMLAAGFQSIALQDNNLSISPGTITLTEPTRTQTVDRNNPHAHGCSISDKVWIEHRFQGITSDTSGESKWVYEWTAPDTMVGDITFYLATLESNYDLTSDGDYTYTRSITSPAIITNIENINDLSTSLKIFPNPAKSILHVNSGNQKIQSITLIDTQGKSIMQVESELQSNALDLRNTMPGIYFLVAQGKETKIVKKIVIQ